MSSYEYRSAGPSGLGGWLILPIIGLFLNVVVFSLALILLASPILAPQIPLLDALAASYTGTSSGEMIYNVLVMIGFLAFSIVLIVKTFKKAPDAPRLFVIYYAVNLGVAILDAIIGGGGFSSVIRAVIGAAIWIPYFNVSKRVSNTFVLRTSYQAAPLDAPAVDKPYDPNNPYSYNPGDSNSPNKH